MVPVRLEEVEALSSVRIYIPKDLRPPEARALGIKVTEAPFTPLAPGALKTPTLPHHTLLVPPLCLTSSPYPPLALHPQESSSPPPKNAHAPTLASLFSFLARLSVEPRYNIF